MNRSFRTRLGHFARGLLMGAADVIPGVSGGTMALILGIYERLIAALSEIVSAVLALVHLNMTDVRHHLRRVEWMLLIPLGLGIVTAIGVGAVVLKPLLETYPAHTNGLFFGLVAASLVIPWQRIERLTRRDVLLGLAAAVLAFFLTGLPARAGDDPTLLRVFATAAVAICAMILPGVSGAFLLKAMGLYETSLNAVREFDVVYVLVFVAGAVVGLGLFSKVLHGLLKHHHDLTMAVLLGLMAGALRALWPWFDETTHALLLPGDGDPVLAVVALAVLGFVFVTAMIRLGRRKVEGG